MSVRKKNPFTLFPIEYQNLWSLYKKHVNGFWTVEEVKLDSDLSDWSKLNDNERYFISHVLAFFAASDSIVNLNLVENFYQEIELTEARSFYSIQIFMENIHSEMYSIMIDSYIKNDDEKDKLFNAITTIPCVEKKANWAFKWFDNFQPIKVRLAAFCCIEGIFFSGSFCAIYWLKNRGLMPGLCTSNEWISRDEGLHCEFAIELFKTLDGEIDQNVIHDIFKDAVEIEKEFITSALPVSLIGMNATLMSQYIEYVADRWLKLLNYEPIWNVTCPFSFMELISLDGKTNFFEHVNTSYQKSTSEKLFSLEEEF